MKKKIIGRIEKVNFPELELSDIDAKIDTGARSSSIHCHHINKVVKDGKSFVNFYLLDPEHDDYEKKLIELPIFDERMVKSSNGHTEKRIFIKTPIIILNETYEIELSLTNRSSMRYPILLGRRILAKNFLVDVSNKYISKKK